MRSSVILSLVALATVTPTLAAPLTTAPQYAKRQTTPPRDTSNEGDESGAFRGLGGPIHHRPWPILPIRPWPFPGKLSKLAREDDLESGAWSLRGVFRAAKTAWNLWKEINRRELGDLSAREFDDNYARELEETFARELIARAGEDESGAFWNILLAAAPAIISGVSSLFRKKGKRDFEEFFTREFQDNFVRELQVAARGDLDDESGAFNWRALFRAVPTILSTVSRVIGKRDFEELSARDFEDLLTRELQEQFSREFLARRDDDDESGAWSFPWRGLLRAAPSIAKVVSSFFKRDPEELFTRVAIEARSLNDLD